MAEPTATDLCIIAGTLARGGAERQLAYAVQALQAVGVAPRIVTLDSGGYWERVFRDQGVDVVSLAHHRGKPARLMALVRALGPRPPRVIHAWHFPVNLYAVAAARLLGARDIGSLRNDLGFATSALGPVFGPASLRLPRLLVVNSQHALIAAPRRGIDAQRVVLLPNVVDTELYRPALRRNDGPLRLLLVARDTPQKRLDRFLRLLAVLIGDGAIEATVIGPISQERLDALSAQCGLPVGWLTGAGTKTPEAIAEAYRTADLLVLTSDHEGTPNVVLEAMASGLACVATACGDVATLLADGRGDVVPADDEAALASAVRRLWAEPARRAELGRRARAYVEDEHGLARLPARLRELYAIPA